MGVGSDLGSEQGGQYYDGVGHGVSWSGCPEAAVPGVGSAFR